MRAKWAQDPELTFDMLELLRPIIMDMWPGLWDSMVRYMVIANPVRGAPLAHKMLASRLKQLAVSTVTIKSCDINSEFC